ncbi:MAG: methyltransferase domain-containing protein, partial [Candidatus Binatia bacterium]
MQRMPTADYDDGWEFKWDDMKTYGPFSRHLRRIIKKMIRPLDFKSVLDVGCGQGSFLKELQTEFPDIRAHGIDISRTAVELARKRMPDG